MTDTPTNQDQEEASIVSRHLPSGYTAEPGDLYSSQIDGPSASAPDLTRPEEEDSLKLLLAEDIGPEALRSTDQKQVIPPLHGALLKNEQDLSLFERLLFMNRNNR